MRKATLDVINIELDKIEYAIEALAQSPDIKEKLKKSIEAIRLSSNEDATMYSTQRRGVRKMRTNLVENNPGLLEAAKKIIALKNGGSIPLSNLCDEKYLRVVITYVKTVMPDLHYYTYPVGNDRVFIKTEGTPIADKGEQFDPTF